MVDSWNKAFYTIQTKKELVLKNINFEFDKANGRIYVRDVTIPNEWKRFTTIESGDILAAVNDHYFVCSSQVSDYIQDLSKFICKANVVSLLFLNKRKLELSEQKSIEEVILIKHFVGLDFIQDVTGKYVIVKSVFQDSAAYESHQIHPGHVLLAVNNICCTNKSVHDVKAIFQTTFPPYTLLLGLPFLVNDYTDETIQLYQKSHQPYTVITDEPFGVDLYMFQQSEYFLVVEGRYKALHQEQWEKRLKDWNTFLQNIGGIDKLNFSYTRTSGKRWEILTYNESSKRRKELRSLIQRGIPYDLRSDVWYYLSGAAQLKEESSVTFEELYKKMDNKRIMQEIDQDICRTFPNHPFFNKVGTPYREKLYNVLYATAIIRSDIGYCQGLNYIAGTLLIITSDAERAFWILYAMLNNLYENDYFDQYLTGANADQLVFEQLVIAQNPDLINRINQYGFSLRVFTLPWFICNFVNIVPMETAMRVWDIMMLEGDKARIRVALAMIALGEKKLLQSQDTGSFYTSLKQLGSMLFDVDELLQIAYQNPKAEQNNNVHVLTFTRDQLAKWRREKRNEIIKERESRE